MGGDRSDQIRGIDLDGLGNVWIAGGTASSDLPTTPQRSQPELPRRLDGRLPRPPAAALAHRPRPARDGVLPEFAGVYQLNRLVAEGTSAGEALPLILEIGDARSRTDVTIAVGP